MFYEPFLTVLLVDLSWLFKVSFLKDMKHPNIVSYYDSFEDFGRLYIVMDYADGGDLEQMIKKRHGVTFSGKENAMRGRGKAPLSG